MKPDPPVSERLRIQMRNSATKLWHQGEFSKYFQAMDRLFRANPRDFLLSIDIGSAHAMRFDYGSAQEWFERAVLVAPDPCDALTRIAVQCRNVNRFDLAEQYLQRASQQQNAGPDTLIKLAEMQERMRRPDAAREGVERALAMDPNHPLALLVRSRLERSAGHLEAGERTLRSFLDRSDADSWSTRIRGWYELGANLDRQGRYDPAMQAFLTAKAMIRPVAGDLLAGHRQTQAILRDAAVAISAPMLRQWADEASQALPIPPALAVICGHPRSGTTLLEQVLDSHPNVVSAEEVPVFYETYRWLKRELAADASMSATLRSASPVKLAEARKWYLRSMQRFIGDPIAGRLLIDKNPSLTGLLPAISRLFPRALILLAVRDPRDVCLSCFMQPLPLNPVSASYLSIEDAATEYASLMGFWLAMKPRLPNPAIEVRYEDMVNDLDSAFRPVMDFLNLDWEPRILQFHEHAAGKLLRSPTYADVARPLSNTAIGRWRNYRKYMEPALDRLAPFIQEFGYKDIA